MSWFLLSNAQLSVRGKNKKEKIGGFFKSVIKSTDEVLISGQKVCDQNDYLKSMISSWK